MNNQVKVLCEHGIGKWKCVPCRRAYDIKYSKEYHQTEKYKKKNRIRCKKQYKRRMYGITLEQEAQMLATQENACAICKRPFFKIKRNLDHIHGTEIVRGILCHNCNSVLELAYERVETLKSAITYLETRGSIHAIPKSFEATVSFSASDIKLPTCITQASRYQTRLK